MCAVASRRALQHDRSTCQGSCPVCVSSAHPAPPLTTCRTRCSAAAAPCAAHGVAMSGCRLPPQRRPRRRLRGISCMRRIARLPPGPKSLRLRPRPSRPRGRSIGWRSRRVSPRWSGWPLTRRCCQPRGDSNWPGWQVSCCSRCLAGASMHGASRSWITGHRALGCMPRSAFRRRRSSRRETAGGSETPATFHAYSPCATSAWYNCPAARSTHAESGSIPAGIGGIISPNTACCSPDWKIV